MDYIISPWWFYLAQVCGTLGVLLGLIGALMFFGGAVLWLWLVKYFDVYEYKSICDSDKRLLTRFKRICIIGAIEMIIGALTPTEETLIKMQIAKFGTYSNAEKVLEVIDKKTDALIDAIGSVKED